MRYLVQDSGNKATIISELKSPGNKCLLFSFHTSYFSLMVLVFYHINFDGLLDPRLLQEVGDLTTRSRTPEAIANLLDRRHPQDLITQIQAIALKILQGDRHQISLPSQTNTKTLP